MALVGSDFHGDVEKLEEFFAYRPDEEHIVLGDVLDGKGKTDAESIECLDLVLHGNARRPDKVNAVWGNHEVGYMYKSPFECGGMRVDGEIPAKMNRCKHRFGVALVRDNYLLTHAGVHPNLARFDDIHVQCNWLNERWMNDYMLWVPGPYATSAPVTPIFYVGSVRKGPNPYGGIFWLDWRRESVSDKYNQVFGHCAGTELYIMNLEGKRIVCVDTTTLECFNTTTGMKETYGFNR